MGVGARPPRGVEAESAVAVAAAGAAVVAKRDAGGSAGQVTGAPSTGPPTLGWTQPVVAPGPTAPRGAAAAIAKEDDVYDVDAAVTVPAKRRRLYAGGVPGGVTSAAGRAIMPERSSGSRAPTGSPDLVVVSAGSAATRPPPMTDGTVCGDVRRRAGAVVTTDAMSGGARTGSLVVSVAEVAPSGTDMDVDTPVRGDAAWVPSAAARQLA